MIKHAIYYILEGQSVQKSELYADVIIKKVIKNSQNNLNFSVDNGHHFIF